MLFPRKLSLFGSKWHILYTKTPLLSKAPIFLLRQLHHILVSIIQRSWHAQYPSHPQLLHKCLGNLIRVCTYINYIVWSTLLVALPSIATDYFYVPTIQSVLVALSQIIVAKLSKHVNMLNANNYSFGILACHLVESCTKIPATTADIKDSCSWY